MPEHSAGSQQFWWAWLPRCASLQGWAAAHSSPGRAQTGPVPELLLAPHGLCWLKEPYGPILEEPLSTSRRCQPSLCSSLLAVTLVLQEPPEPWRPQGHALCGADSASSLPSPCFLHRCLLLQLEESSKGNKSLKQASGRQRAWVEVPVTQWPLQPARTMLTALLLLSRCYRELARSHELMTPLQWTSLRARV